MATLIKTDGTTKQVKPANGRYFTLEEKQGFVGGLIEFIPTREGNWLTPADIGVSYSRLRAINLKEPYENGKCIIRLGELQRVSTNRGKQPKYKNIEDW